jgi:hypothetical protein
MKVRANAFPSLNSVLFIMLASKGTFKVAMGRRKPSESIRAKTSVTKSSAEVVIGIDAPLCLVSREQISNCACRNRPLQKGTGHH